MATPSRKRVALLVETSLGSGREILRGIARYAHQTDQWQMFHVPRGLREVLPDWLDQWQGDGIIARVQDARMVETLKRLKVPAVDVLGLMPDSPFPLVHVDDSRIAYEVAGHFLERGFQRFAFYGIKDENWSERRRDAFFEAILHMGDGYRLETPRSASEGSLTELQQLRDWLETLPKPIAIMVCSDQRALSLLEACRSANIAVPEQVAVAGVDNDVPLCEIASPPLTSVRAGHFRAGYEAALLLDRLMNGESPERLPARLVEPTGIVVRQSTDTKALEDAAVAQAVRYIYDHLALSLTIDKVAQACRLSRTLFQKRFRTATQMTVHDFIAKARLKRAVTLIRNSDLPLGHVAQIAGYRHQEYMGAVIREKLGKTPGELRRDGSTTIS